MASRFDTWLRELKRSGKGGVVLDAARRGSIYQLIINFPGDRTADTLRGQVRESPDAPGDPLASFSVSAGTYDGTADVTTFVAAIGAVATAGLPEDGDLDGVAEFAVDFLIDDGDIEELLFGAALPVAGRVTV